MAPVSVFAELDDERVEVFVKDRGPGFDPDRVAPDRMGVRESILGRMERHGGHAEVRTAPGEGTEVRLTARRAAAARGGPAAARPEQPAPDEHGPAQEQAAPPRPRGRERRAEQEASGGERGGEHDGAQHSVVES